MENRNEDPRVTTIVTGNGNDDDIGGSWPITLTFSPVVGATGYAIYETMYYVDFVFKTELTPSKHHDQRLATGNKRKRRARTGRHR
jgi:hypothetical protein